MMYRKFDIIHKLKDIHFFGMCGVRQQGERDQKELTGYSQARLTKVTPNIPSPAHFCVFLRAALHSCLNVLIAITGVNKPIQYSILSNETEVSIGNVMEILILSTPFYTDFD